MPTTITPEWQQIALYAVGAAVLLTILMRIPFVGRLLRAMLTLGLFAFFIFLLIEQAPFEPRLARLADRLGLDGQEVAGDEVRIRMASDGHFWANVTVNGVKRRMLVDSGATITAISEATAAAASIDADTGLVPVMLQTANGMVQARKGTVDLLRVGTVEAKGLRVVVSPALGNLDVLGMNFLTQLESWRVEGRTLVLTPKPAEGEKAGKA
ncbi:MAG TPA: TIGR02281 family clan AA aspartic protease [Allosphingosinicella sp.]